MLSDISYRSHDARTDQVHLPNVSLTELSFWLPFVTFGTVFAAMPIANLIEHPSAHFLPDLTAAIWVGYSTMGAAFGLAGLVILSMFRSTARLLGCREGEDKA